MKLNDILTESQIDELGIAKKIAGGVRGAVTGFKSSRDKRAGMAHSNKIVDNLRKEFMKQVGGGAEPTMQNLLSFLQNQGLDVSSIDMDQSEPEQAPKQRVEPYLDQKIEPTLEPEKTAGPSTSSTGGTVTNTPTGLQHKASSDNPNQPKKPSPGANAFGSMVNQLGGGAPAEPESPPPPKRTGGKVPGVVSQTPNAVRKRASRSAKRSGGVVKEDAQLNAVAINDIIKAVVQKNYSKIRQAQAGILPPPTVDLTQFSRSAEPKPEVPVSNVFANPQELEKSWDEFLKAGGSITDEHKKLFAKLAGSASATTAPSAPPPTPAKESVFYSRFLNKSL